MASFPIFEWKPDLGAAPTSKPLVTAVSFGDGYEQRVGESLNRVKTTWTLVFTRPIKEALEIRQFLIDRAGLESFQWTDTLGQTAHYVCREWQGPTQQQRGLYTITANFEQVFET